MIDSIFFLVRFLVLILKMLKGLLSFWLIVKLDHIYYKNKKNGKAQLSFTKDQIPEDKESPKYHMMIDLKNLILHLKNIIILSTVNQKRQV